MQGQTTRRSRTQLGHSHPSHPPGLRRPKYIAGLLVLTIAVVGLHAGGVGAAGSSCQNFGGFQTTVAQALIAAPPETTITMNESGTAEGGAGAPASVDSSLVEDVTVTNDALRAAADADAADATTITAQADLVVALGCEETVSQNLAQAGVKAPAKGAQQGTAQAQAACAAVNKLKGKTGQPAGSQHPKDAAQAQMSAQDAQALASAKNQLAMVTSEIAAVRKQLTQADRDTKKAQSELQTVQADAGILTGIPAPVLFAPQFPAAAQGNAKAIRAPRAQLKDVAGVTAAITAKQMELMTLRSTLTIAQMALATAQTTLVSATSNLAMLRAKARAVPMPAVAVTV
jgi:hypothetical protein